MANAAASLDSIIIEVETKAGEASNGIERLTNTLATLKKGIEGGFNNINRLAEGLNALKPASEGLSSVAKNLENIGSVTSNLKKLSEIETPSGLTYTISRLKELAEESEKLERTSTNVANINKIVQPLTSLAMIPSPKGLGNLVRYLSDLSKLGNLDNVISEAQKLPQLVQPLSSFSQLETSKGLGTLIRNLERLPEVMNKIGNAEALQNIGRVATELVGHLKPLSAEMEKIARGYSALSSMANTYGVSAQTVTRYTKQHVSLFKILGGILDKVKGQFKNINSASSQFGANAIKQFSKFNSKLKQVMLSLIGTRSLFTMLRKAVSEYTAMDVEFQKFTQNVWRAFGAQLAPIIEYAMNLFKQFVRVIYSVVLALTGVDLISRANQKAMAGWGKSAKDTLGNLQKFDDLNVAEFPSSSSGGGDNSLIDLDKIDLTPFMKIIEWVRKMKQAIDEALDTGKWYNVGKVFAEGLNMAIDFLLSKLPVVEKFFLDVAENFGEFLNGVIENVNWAKLSELIGKSFMIIPKSLEKLFTTINWTSLGRAIDAFFEAFPLTGLVHSIMRAFGSAVEGFFQMMLAINWVDVAKKIGNAIVTFFSDLSSILAKIPWRQVGEAIADAIKAFPWKDVWNSIVKLAKTAFKSLEEFIGGLFNIDAEGLERIEKALIGIGLAFVTYKIVDSVGKLSTGLINFGKQSSNILKVKDSFASIKDKISGIGNALTLLKGNPMLTGDIMKMTNLAGLNSGLASITSSLSGIVAAVGGLAPFIAILAAVVVAVMAVATAFRQLWKENEGFRNTITDLGKSIKETFIKALAQLMPKIQELWKALKEFFDEVIKPLFQLLVDIAKPFIIYLVDILSVLWKNVLAPLIDVTISFADGALSILINAIKLVTADLKIVIGVFRELWKKILEPIATYIANTLVGIVDRATSKIKNSLTQIKNTMETIKSVAGKVIDGIKSLLKAGINWMLGQIEAFINRTINGINSLIRSINRIKIKVPDGIPGIGGSNFGFSLPTMGTVSLPRLETGTNEIPYEGIYHLHPGEAVVPKQYNPALGGGTNRETNERLDTLISILNDLSFTNIVNIGNERIYQEQQNFNKFQQNKYGTTDLY